MKLNRLLWEFANENWKCLIGLSYDNKITLYIPGKLKNRLINKFEIYLQSWLINSIISILSSVLCFNSVTVIVREFLSINIRRLKVLHRRRNIKMSICNIMLSGSCLFLLLFLQIFTSLRLEDLIKKKVITKLNKQLKEFVDESDRLKGF